MLNWKSIRQGNTTVGGNNTGIEVINLLFLIILASVSFNIFMIAQRNYCLNKRMKEMRNREKSIKVLEILIRHCRGRKEIGTRTCINHFDLELEIVKFMDDFLLEELRESRFSKSGMYCIHGWVIRDIPELSSFYCKIEEEI